MPVLRVWYGRHVDDGEIRGGAKDGGIGHAAPESRRQYAPTDQSREISCAIINIFYLPAILAPVSGAQLHETTDEAPAIRALNAHLKLLRRHTFAAVERIVLPEASTAPHKSAVIAAPASIGKTAVAAYRAMPPG